LSRGGEDEWENRVTACRRCNILVGEWDRDLKEEFRSLLQEEGWGAVPRKGNNRPNLTALASLLYERMDGR
jgi:hypothetical protein